MGQILKYRFTLDKRRVKKDGTYPIVLQVHNQDKVRVSTPYSAIPEEWDDDKFFIGKSENRQRKNAVLGKMKYEIDKLCFTLADEKKSVTDKELRIILSGILSAKPMVEKVKSFIDYLDEFISKKSSEGTKTIYTTTRNKIMAFDKCCTFESMDRKWLERFEVWMIESGMKVNAYAIHLRNIRAVFNYAIDEEYTTLYPFRKFQIKKEETRKRSLSLGQLRQLRDYPCEEYQVRYRDMFMLMFYLIGINAADLFLARKSDVVDGRLEYKRAKTGKLYSVKIEPEAQTIIDRYKGKGEYLLNVMDEYGNYKDFLHRMGNALKDIGEMHREGRGGKKIRQPLFPELSSYWSRHTWATIAAGLEIPKETIGHALGHTWAGNTTTDIYILFDRKKVDEANRAVIDCVNGTE